MNDPYLFDDLATDPALVPHAVPVYTTPIEQATFDIMELVDLFFRSSITVEEYDDTQKKVKGILVEAFDEKKPVSPGNGGHALLLVPHDQS